MNVKLCVILILVMLSIGAAGCSITQHSFGLEPVKPYNDLGFDARVDSLQPEFQWKASEVDGATYDFAVWKANPNRGQLGIQSWGEFIYGVEYLKVNHHVIEKPLLPHTVYCWSVRERRDKDNYIGVWSSKNRSGFGGQTNNAPFYFKTPENAKIP